MENHNKIIYFDKETINNLLEQSNKGSKITRKRAINKSKVEGEIASESKIDLKIPFSTRLGFLFSGKLSTSFINELVRETSVTSTDISEFMKIKDDLKIFSDIQVSDIENSSTFYRVAGGYLNMVKGNVDGVDVKEFNLAMQNFEGYDTYKIKENVYVRFNNTSFVSNYRRNDLLTTKLEIVCMSVGTFEAEEFDFLHQISKMELLMNGVDSSNKLSDLYPGDDCDVRSMVEEDIEGLGNENMNDLANENIISNRSNNVELFDVLYATIFGGSNVK